MSAEDVSPIFIESSDEDMPPVTVDDLVRIGVQGCIGFAQGSGGLFHSPRVLSDRWRSTARAVIELEARAGAELTETRALLDRILTDPWCRITANWDEVRDTAEPVQVDRTPPHAWQGVGACGEPMACQFIWSSAAGRALQCTCPPDHPVHQARRSSS